MTSVLRVDPHNPDADVIARAADCLRQGGLVAFPTETVYGLGADALNAEAVRRVFEAKRRPTHDPLIVHVGAASEISQLVAAVPPAAHALAERFWPGPLTLVMHRSSLVPNQVTGGLDTVAVRVPAHPVARAIISAAAIPIAAPSANLFSRPSPTSAEHVLQDLEGRIDLVVDAGPTFVGLESTVVDLSRDVPTVLRPGAVTLDMLRQVIPDVRVDTPLDDPEVVRAPGTLAKHYSPRAPLALYEGQPRAVIERLMWDATTALAGGHVVGVLIADEDAAPLTTLNAIEGPPPHSKRRLHIVQLGSERDLDTVATRLYSALRELDAAGVDQILVRGFPDEKGLGLAIRDRLRRAAGGRIIRC